MVKIANAYRGIVISDKAQVAASFSEKLLGILNPKNSRFLIINTHFGIHTLFMKSPIDVILIDRKNIVVKTKTNLNPNSLFLYSPKYKTVIEMPKGSIKKYQININDKISIE